MKRPTKRRIRKNSRRPLPLNRKVHRGMQLMPTKNSAPEITLRRLLHRRGLRYRLHANFLPGRPDIVFSLAKLAVFVDGCFWHYCPIHGTVPKHNRNWWSKKLLATRERDRRKDFALEERGWLAIHVWEHENMEVAAASIALRVKQRHGK